VGGEAAWQAGRALRKSILDLAATIHQRDAASLDIRRGLVVDAENGQEITSLSEVGRIAYFRPDTLGGMRPELSVTRHYLPTQYAFAFTNGILACHLEADPETGFIKLLKFWAVEDCGKVLNPLLVEEQMRGAIVQGIGPTLFEECLYDSNGQMLNGSMVDYLVPMAAEMPDMDVAHVETLTRESAIGAKGAGEAGTAGAPAAIMNALNDALSPFRVEITEMPFTPERILRALGKA
jgi:carbon-monoxide dehydrogenase large subunit